MDKKVPVVGTAVEAFVFAFQNFLSILRIGWFPVLLAAVLILAGVASGIAGLEGLQRQMEQGPGLVVVPEHQLDAVLQAIDELPLPGFDIPVSVPGQVMAFGGFTGTLLLLIAAPLALIPILSVTYEVSAGRRDWPRGFLFFRFGARELRLLFAHYLVSIGVVAFGIAVLPPLYVAFLISASSLEPGVIAVVGIMAALVFVAALIWFVLRTTAVPAAIATENRLIFIEAFKATRANVWRLLFATIIVGILLFLFQLVAFVIFAALSAAIPHLPGILAGILGLLVAVLTAGYYIIVLTVQAAFDGKVWAAVRGNVITDDVPPAEAALADASEEDSDLSAPASRAEGAVGEDTASEAATMQQEAAGIRRDMAATERQFVPAYRDEEALPARPRAEGSSIAFVRSRFR